MLALRLSIHLRALAWIAALAAGTPLAAETTPPPALPLWPDEAPSVYATANLAKVQQSATPAPISAPSPPIVQIAAVVDDARRLAPPGDRRPHAAKQVGKEAAAMPVPSFGLDLDSVYTMATALAVVVGLFLLCAGLVRRGAKKSNSVLPEEVVSVLGRVPLAARQFAELVRVGNKLVLVSVTQHGAEPLTEITDPVEIDRLVGLCRERTTRSSTAEFEQIFRQLAEDTAPSGFLGNEGDRYADYRGGASRA